MREIPNIKKNIKPIFFIFSLSKKENDNNIANPVTEKKKFL